MFTKKPLDRGSNPRTSTSQFGFKALPWCANPRTFWCASDIEAERGASVLVDKSEGLVSARLASSL